MVSVVAVVSVVSVVSVVAVVAVVSVVGVVSVVSVVAVVATDPSPTLKKLTSTQISRSKCQDNSFLVSTHLCFRMRLRHWCSQRSRPYNETQL